MRALFGLCLFCSILVGCGGGGGVPVAAPVATGWAIANADRLYVDDDAEIDSLRLVITDAETFRLRWGQATRAQASPPPPPAVDFGRDLVLMVTNGRQQRGDRIQVDSIVFATEVGADGEQRVMQAVVRTTRECNPFPGNSYPVEIVRVQKSDLPVRFVDRPPPPCPDLTAATTEAPELLTRPGRASALVAPRA